MVRSNAVPRPGIACLYAVGIGVWNTDGEYIYALRRLADKEFSTLLQVAQAVRIVDVIHQDALQLQVLVEH